MPRTALRTITVRELIEDLEEQDPDMPVVFTSDYGDIVHTQQVHAITGSCEEEALTETAYSVSGWAVRDVDYNVDRDEPDGEDDAPRVLVIR
jgi:hypothetical protein